MQNQSGSKGLDSRPIPELLSRPGAVVLVITLGFVTNIFWSPPPPFAGWPKKAFAGLGASGWVVAFYFTILRGRGIVSECQLSFRLVVSLCWRAVGKEAVFRLLSLVCGKENIRRVSGVISAVCVADIVCERICAHCEYKIQIIKVQKRMSDFMNPC